MPMTSFRVSSLQVVVAVWWFPLPSCRGWCVGCGDCLSASDDDAEGSVIPALGLPRIAGDGAIRIVLL
ncbi:hypothetical protein Dimus_036669 [Dionaea muscipula]